MGWLAPVAQAGGGIIDSLANVFGAKKREQRAFDRQKELIEDERAYNDPSMQMQRLKQAGINPAMAFSKGNMQNTVSSSGKSVAMAQAPRTNIGQSLGSAIMMKSQLDLIKSQERKNNSDASYTNQKITEQEIDNFVDSFIYQFHPDGEAAKYEWKGKEYNANEMYKRWMKGDEDIPPWLQSKFMDMTRQGLDNQNTSIKIQINQAERNLKQLGYTFSDDMAVRVGIMMAIEKGYDMSTAQGLTMAYGLISQVAPIFMKTGALKSLGRNTAKSVQPNKLSGKIKSQHKTISKSKSGRTTTSRTRNIYHD